MSKKKENNTANEIVVATYKARSKYPVNRTTNMEVPFDCTASPTGVHVLRFRFDGQGLRDVYCPCIKLSVAEAADHLGTKTCVVTLRLLLESLANKTPAWGTNLDARLRIVLGSHANIGNMRKARLDLKAEMIEGNPDRMSLAERVTHRLNKRVLPFLYQGYPKITNLRFDTDHEGTVPVLRAFKEQHVILWNLMHGDGWRIRPLSMIEGRLFDAETKMRCPFCEAQLSSDHKKSNSHRKEVVNVLEQMAIDIHNFKARYVDAERREWGV